MPFSWSSIQFSNNLPKENRFFELSSFQHKSWFCNAILKIQLDGHAKPLPPPPSCSIKFLFHWAMTNMYSMIAMKIVFPPNILTPDFHSYDSKPWLRHMLKVKVHFILRGFRPSPSSFLYHFLYLIERSNLWYVAISFRMGNHN